MGAVRGRKTPHHPRERGYWGRWRKRQHGAGAEDCGADAPERQCGRQRQRRDPAAAIRRRQVQKRHTPAPRVQLTGVGEAGGGMSQRGTQGKGRRPRGHLRDSGSGANGDDDGGRNRAACAQACDRQEDGSKDQIPPDRPCALNVCGHPGGGGGGGTLTWQRAPTTRSQGPEGDPPTGSAQP